MAKHLAPGTASLPGEKSVAALPNTTALCLGGGQAQVQLVAGASQGRVLLAPDVWARLAVPYAGIRLQLAAAGTAGFALGPVITVLWPGIAAATTPATALRRLRLFFGHMSAAPGLFTLGFDGDVDWVQGTIGGYVLDHRSASAGAVVAARAPLPDAAFLTWAIRREVIDRLRAITGDRTFNWVRSIGKWQFHTLLAADEALHPHLPDTRLLRGPADLAAMLTRHGVVYVKNVHSIRGRAVVRVRQTLDLLEVRHMAGDRLAEAQLTTLAETLAYVRGLLGPGRAIVQQGIPITGRTGRAVDFRVVTVRDRAGEWYSPTTIARVAADDRQVITNVAAGAESADVLTGLESHCGCSPVAARQCAAAMVDLCLAAARVLSGPFHPLGILGFDVAVAADSRRLWLLEANPVPGWGYPRAIEQTLARSQVDYALRLAGYPPGRGHSPA